MPRSTASWPPRSPSAIRASWSWKGGMDNALRSYYMLQQLHSRYCLTNADRHPLRRRRRRTARHQPRRGHRALTSARRSSPATPTAPSPPPTAAAPSACGATPSAAQLDLPPNGYAGWTADGAIEVLSGDRTGPSRRLRRHPRLPLRGWPRPVHPLRPKPPATASASAASCRQGQYESFSTKTPSAALPSTPTSAVALDKDSKELGPAQLRTARGLTYVMPVKGAFSYRLTANIPDQKASQADDDYDPEHACSSRVQPG